MICIILYRRWVNKLNVKQFKKRFIRGLVEPDLFKLPVKEKEKKLGRLQVNLLTYSSYDLDNEKIIETDTQITYGAIVVKDSKDNIVYNSKNNNDSYRFYTPFLPYGNYKIKVIRAKDEKVDNQWYEVTINNDIVIKNIILSWFPVSKSEVYIKEDEELPCYFVGNYSSKYVSYNEFSVKGVLHCKVYEGDKLIIDEPFYKSSLIDFYTISSSENFYTYDLTAYSFPCTSSITASYSLTACKTNAETSSCNITWTRTPCPNKTLDKTSILDNQGITNHIGYDGSYEGETIYTTVKDKNPSDMKFKPVIVKYNCTYNGTQEGSYYAPQNKTGTNYCQALYFNEFGSRPNPNDSFGIITGSPLLTIAKMFGFSMLYEDRFKDGDDSSEYNGDKFYYHNNSVMLIGFVEKNAHSDEPHSEFFAYVRTKEEYEKYEERISKGLHPTTASDSIPSEMDRYEYIRINKGTHFPYTQYLSQSELYPHYIKSHSKIRNKAVKAVSKLNNQTYYSKYVTISQNEEGSEYTLYTFNAYTSYSDDYDQY